MKEILKLILKARKTENKNVIKVVNDYFVKEIVPELANILSVLLAKIEAH